MPRKVDAHVAEADMVAAGAQPLVPYKNSYSPWMCKCLACGSEISPSLASVRRGQGVCVYCAGKRVDPEQAWQRMLKANLTPLVPYPGSDVKWLCVCEGCGREVSPTYSNIRTGHTGCRYCVGNFADETRARKLFLDKGLTPLEPYVSARKPWKSIHLVCGNLVQPTFNSVQQGSSGCGHCARNIAIGETQAVQVAEEKGFQPLEPFPGTHQPWSLKHIKCGRTVKPSLSTLKGSVIGCAYCANIRVDPNEAEDFVRTLGMTLLSGHPGSNSPWPLLHQSCGMLINPTYNSLRQGVRCAYCSKSRVDPEQARLRMVERELLPLEPYPGSSKPWLSRHLICGEVVSPKYQDVMQGSRGCRHCAANRVEEEFALSIFQAAGFTPKVPYPGSNTGWLSVHEVCGKMVSPRYGYVRRFGAGCGFCAGRRVDADEAILVMKSVGLTPLEPYPGQNSLPWLCIHDACGREVSPRYNSIQGGQGGCAHCANSGFDPASPAYLYLITHQELSAHKVGIGSTGSKRLDRHRQLGWLQYKSLAFSTGIEAYEIEQAVLRTLREDLGLYPFLTKRDMPQGGWTETVDASEISLSQLWSHIKSCVSDKSAL